MRTFLALDLTPAQRDALARVQDALPPGLRLTDPDDLHLTLAFLGERPEDEVVAAHEGFETVRHPPVLLRPAGLGTFEKGGEGAIWAGLADEAGVRSLHAKALASLHGAGIMLDRRRFRPHVTLARPGRTPPDPARLAAALGRWHGFPAPEAERREMVLVRSTLRPTGAVHEEIARYAFA